MLAVQQSLPVHDVELPKSDMPALAIAYYLPGNVPVYIAPVPTWDATSKRIIGMQPVRWIFRLGWQVGV